MPTLLLRAGLRQLGHHPLQAFLAVSGVALGVGVVVSLDLASESSRRALRASVATVVGEATHRVESGPGGIPSELVARLRGVPGVQAAAPVVEGYVTSPHLPGRPLRVLGIDPLAERSVRPFARDGGEGLALLRVLAEEGSVLLGADLAAEGLLPPGDVLPLVVGGRDREVRVAGVLEPEDELARAGLRDVLLADVATAQELFERPGGVDRIDLVLSDRGRRDVASRVEELLPGGVRLDEAGARERAMEAMTRSFDLNLRALGLLALLFGAFLIYNTMAFQVVRRRRMLGTFRALGATRGEVVGAVLAEALVLGAAGTMLGLLLGTVLAGGLVRLVTRTINDLYFVLAVEGVSLAPASLARGAFLGLGVTLLAALPSTWEAVSTSPRTALARSFLEERSRGGAVRLVWGGLLLTALGTGLLLLPTPSVVPAFAGLFALVAGVACLTPAALAGAVRLAAPIVRHTFGLLGAMSARGVAASLSRTGPASAALVAVVSVTLGLGLMISSFRASVERWLDVTLGSDVYVSAPSAVSAGSGGTLPDEVVRVLTGAPEVESVSLTRSVRVLDRMGELRILAVEAPADQRARFELVSGPGTAVRDALQQGKGLLVSEPLAFRRGLAPGDVLRLLSPEGERPFPVLGVFRDYGADQGVAVMARETYLRYWNDPEVTSMGLTLVPDLGADEALARLRSGLPPGVVVDLRSDRDLREATLHVFDRTFRITSVLQGLLFLVAFIGVLNALMALQLERARELGVLRATGLLPSEVWRVVLGQTGVIGVFAGLFALPAGLMVAFVMTAIVNRRSFGWTVDLAVSPELVGQAVLLAVAGALLAGLYPSWKMSRASPASVLRDE